MSHSLLLKALGWALLNSLWQYGLLWFIFYLVTGSSRKITPALRHGFALVLSFTGILWFAISLLSHLYYPGSSASETPQGFIPLQAYNALINIQQFADDYLIYITWIYLIIAGTQMTKFTYFFHRSHSLHTAGISKAQVELRLYVQKMALQLHIRRSVRVFISELVDTPLVIGFLKPTILMPLACINQLSLPQLEAILLHELAHIKRNDYLVNIYVGTMEILFFFNPFARLLMQAIKHEREHSCDDWVMQHQFSPHLYASALLTLEQNRSRYLSTGIAATGVSRKILLHRVQRILQVQTEERNTSTRLTACLAACCLICLLAWLQPAAVTQPLQDYTKQLKILAGKMASHKQPSTRRTDVSAEHPLRIINESTADESVKDEPATETAEPEELEQMLLPVSVDEDISNVPLLEAVSTENRNFSIPDLIQPELPLAAEATGFPYVPSSSFYSTDTVKPRVKAETYYERNARESLLKTKKALNEINWKAIQKRLSSKVDIAVLRRELEQSINQLNWQRINDEVKDSLNQQTIRNYQGILYQEYDEVKKWKTRQQQVEDLQIQLQKQHKYYQTDAEKKAADVNKKLAGYKIIVSL